MGQGRKMLEDYRSFIDGKRDNRGFLQIDIDDIRPEELEMMGSEDKTKFWVEFSDGSSALIKVENEKQTAGFYAELIVEKLAEQVGLEHAKNDLVMYNGKEGIISKSIIEENEKLYTLNSILDKKDIEKIGLADTEDLYSVCKAFIKWMGRIGLSREKSEKMLEDFQKQMVFDLFVMGEDTHLENISIIRNNDTKEYRISPKYDSECSLMLDRDIETLKKLADGYNFEGIKFATENIYPKIALVPEEKEDCTGEEIYKYTFSQYIEDDDVGDFAYDCCEKLNIKAAIEEVEKQIGAPIPDEIKLNLIVGFNHRKQELNEVMEKGYDPIGDESIDEDFGLF